MKLCVGLTGGIGCGKSSVSKLFAEEGAGIIDTDVIAHQLTQSHGKGISEIRQIFGDTYLTEAGALDRHKMRTLIFSSADAKQQLEALLHPLILEQVKAQIQLSQNKPYNIVVVPLLFASLEFKKLVGRVLLVDCAEDTQVMRVMARSQMTEIEIRQIISQQTPRTQRLRQADDVLNNDTSLSNLTERVNILHKMYATLQNNN